MEDIKSKTFVSWDELESLVDDLCTKIVRSGVQIEHIYGLPRGGLIPAVMISHKLNIPMTSKPISHNILIVDDICDSGETFFSVEKKYHEDKLEIKFACLHLKPHTSIFTPEFCGRYLYSNAWIVYPWEHADAEPIQDYLKYKNI